MQIKMIFACDKHMGIGMQNKLPWGRLKADMEFFKNKTLGKKIIMGKNTYVSLGRPLPKRHNIVLSSSLINTNPNVEVFKTLKELYSKYEMCEESFYVIGGAQIYSLFENVAQVIYQTVINNHYSCDTFYSVPEFFHLPKLLKLQEKDENNAEGFKIYKYEKKT